MLLMELYNPDMMSYQDVNQDNSQPRWQEFRKTKLTLSSINKIRRMNEVQAYEKARDLKLIRQQYSPPAQGPGL